jgi:hypothetical protein
VKAAKYLIRGGWIEEGEEVNALFSRGEVERELVEEEYDEDEENNATPSIIQTLQKPPVDGLPSTKRLRYKPPRDYWYDMQSQWYFYGLADSYTRPWCPLPLSSCTREERQSWKEELDERNRSVLRCRCCEVVPLNDRTICSTYVGETSILPVDINVSTCVTTYPPLPPDLSSSHILSASQFCGHQTQQLPVLSSSESSAENNKYSQDLSLYSNKKQPIALTSLRMSFFLRRVGLALRLFYHMKEIAASAVDETFSWYMLLCL